MNIKKIATFHGIFLLFFIFQQKIPNRKREYSLEFQNQQEYNTSVCITLGKAEVKFKLDNLYKITEQKKEVVILRILYNTMDWKDDV